jgi:ribosomal protein S1
MTEAPADAVAGIEEVSRFFLRHASVCTDGSLVFQTPDDDQLAFKKTHTNKRPKEARKAKKPLSEFQVGSTVPGKVVSIMPYGAFVDIGTTTDGLVHVSQISDEFVSDISTIVKVGDEVQVRIVSVEADTNKISLSMRSENAKPRAPREGGAPRAEGGGRRAPSGGSKELPEEFRKFDSQKVLKGKVVSVLEYGAFVSIAEGVEALVHVSEMTEDRETKPDSLVKVGDEVSRRRRRTPPLTIVVCGFFLSIYLSSSPRMSEIGRKA